MKDLTPSTAQAFARQMLKDMKDDEEFFKEFRKRHPEWYERKMKILFIGNMNDIHTPKWARWFEEHGHEVHRAHIKNLRHGMRQIRSLRRWARKEFRPNIVHSHYGGTWGLIGLLLGIRPFIVTVHGSEVLLTKGIRRFLVKQILKRADLVTTDAKHVRDAMWKMGINKGKIRIIRFGVDVRKFSPKNEGFYPPAVIYRIGPDPILYGEETIKKALELIRMNLSSIPITKMAPDMVAWFLQRGSVYVSAALSDAGLSATTAEAMACELPVVISAVAENRLWAQSDRQLFPPGDHRALAEKIRWFLENPKQCQKFGLMNRMKILRSNEYKFWMSMMEKIYKEVHQKWQRRDGRKGRMENITTRTHNQKPRSSSPLASN